jgi:hypothetical protein
MSANHSQFPSGAKQAAEKGRFSDKSSENIPPGLKPAMILAHLRHG